MAAYMGYTIAIAALLALSGHLLERCCIWVRGPTRIIWITALIVGAFGPLMLSGYRSTIAMQSDPAISSTHSMVDGSAQLQPVGQPGTVLPSIQWLDPLLLGLWLAASVAMGIGLVTLARRARRMARSATPARISGAEVLLTDHIGPALIGAFRYRILLPRWVAEMDPAQQEMIVAHELQHARRFDPALMLMGAVVVVLFPWNVMLWYMMRRLRTSTELDCDLRVLDQRVDAHAYMALLIDVSERLSVTPAFASGLIESPSQLHQRLLAMTMQSTRMNRSKSTALLLLAVLVLGGAMRLPTPAPELRGNGIFESLVQGDTIPLFEYQVTEPAKQLEGPAPRNTLPRFVRRR